MKERIVEYIGGEALTAARRVRHEAEGMQRNYREVFFNTSEKGLGLDMVCLLEELAKVEKFCELIAPDRMIPSEGEST